jgi:1,4-alpha-glucan branching enzyme
MSKKVEKEKKQNGKGHILPNLDSAKTRFVLDRPDAQVVYLCGDFNDWSPTGLRMLRSNGHGAWEKSLALARGRYEYKFLVDGEWIADPNARRTAPNAFGSLNSVLEVSG